MTVAPCVRADMCGRVVQVLLGVAAVPFDMRAQHRALIAELRAKPRPRDRPERKFSVAQLEEQQRNKGATIEFLDDLSAAMATSPKRNSSKK